MANEQIDEVPGQLTITPLNVVYCGVCGLPPEYCEFGASYDSCLHWLSDNHPDLFEQIQNSLRLIPKKNKDRIGENSTEEKKGSDQAQTSQNLEEKENDSDDGEEKDGESKGKKNRKNKKKKESKKGQTQPSTSGSSRSAQKVIISLVARTKRKQSTVISGLDSFPDIKLKNVAKVLGKKFSSGCSVTETNITIQGDFTDTLPDILITEFNIPSRAISISRELATAPEGDEEEEI